MEYDWSECHQQNFALISIWRQSVLNAILATFLTICAMQSSTFRR